MNSPKLKNSEISGSFQDHVSERAMSGIPKGLLIQNEALGRLVEYHANQRGVSVDDFLAKAVNSYVAGNQSKPQCSVLEPEIEYLSEERRGCLL